MNELNIRPNRVQYLVRWENFDASHDEWLYQEDFVDNNVIIDWWEQTMIHDWLRVVDRRADYADLLDASMIRDMRSSIQPDRRNRETVFHPFSQLNALKIPGTSLWKAEEE